MADEELWLKKIIVEDLFYEGSPERVINLDNEERIGLLLAENGYGKTTIMQIVKFMFAPTIAEYISVCRIQFSQVRCELSNGRVVVLKRQERKNVLDVPAREGSFRDLNNGDIFRSETHYLTLQLAAARNYLPWSEGEIEAPETGRERLLKALWDEPNEQEKRNKSDKPAYEWFLLQHSGKNPEKQARDIDECVSDEEVAEVFGVSLRAEADRTARLAKYYVLLIRENAEIKNVLKEKAVGLDISFIRADRLHRHWENDVSEKILQNLRIKVEDNQLKVVCEEFKRYLENLQNKYNEEQAGIKDMLINEYICSLKDEEKLRMANKLPKWSKFQEDFNKYKKKLGEIIEVGLLPKKRYSDEIGEEDYERGATFFNVYLHVFSKPVKNLYEDDFEKLRSFLDIFQNRFQGKRLQVSRDKGLAVVFDGSETEFSLDKLSSGERQLIILFYKLLYKTQKRRFVMIDEPEISWHISWQKPFLQDLAKICEKNKLHAMVATHSPSILNEQFEYLLKREV